MLQCPYDYERAKLIVWEMTDLLVLDLVDKGLVTDQMVLTVGYDIENLTNPDIRKLYKGEIVTDYFGRKIPKHAHGTANIGRLTSSTKPEEPMSQSRKMLKRLIYTDNFY